MFGRASFSRCRIDMTMVKSVSLRPSSPAMRVLSFCSLDPNSRKLWISLRNWRSDPSITSFGLVTNRPLLPFLPPFMGQLCLPLNETPPATFDPRPLDLDRPRGRDAKTAHLDTMPAILSKDYFVSKYYFRLSPGPIEEGSNSSVTNAFPRLPRWRRSLP